MKLTNAFAALAATTVLAATPALAEKRVTISNWTSPNHATSRGHAAFAEMTESEFPDAFDFKLFAGGALLGPKPTLSGLRDGVADVGLLALTYFRSEMPYAQLVADLALLGEGPLCHGRRDQRIRDAALPAVQGRSSQRTAWWR